MNNNTGPGCGISLVVMVVAFIAVVAAMGYLGTRQLPIADPTASVAE